MNEQRVTESALARLGFRFGPNGTHAARTMMLDDVRALLAALPPDAGRAQYKDAVTAANVLGKPTRKARELAWRHLSTLYGLSDDIPVFRAMRRLWPQDAAAQPVIAAAVAASRDPLLRAMWPFLADLPFGQVALRESLEARLDQMLPGRFSPASRKSFAQNLLGTWTAGGWLLGHRRKVRHPVPLHPASAAMLLFLGYLEGRSGQRLFSGRWYQLADAPPDEWDRLITAASHRGVVVYMSSGGVKELRFPGYLSAEEEKIRQELSHVI